VIDFVHGGHDSDLMQCCKCFLVAGVILAGALSPSRKVML